MPGLMNVFESLPQEAQEIASEMCKAAREAMRAHGLRPRNDDHAAIFENACAVYLRHAYSGTSYANETNERLVEMLEMDEGDVDAISKEIKFRERLGGWMTWDEQMAVIVRVNPSARV
jgi:hypothetical protein